jgi:hypothetical protein
MTIPLSIPRRGIRAVINTGDTAARVGDGADPKGHGRWRLNSGSEMMMMAAGVAADQDGDATPFRAVIDLGTCQIASQRIMALYDHDPNKIIGYWDNFSVSSAGIEADLHLVPTETDALKTLFPDSARVQALLAAGVRPEVSVSADPMQPEDWQHVPSGATIQANGDRTYSGDGEYPLHVLHNARVYESSIVCFGADSVTGRIAATRTPPLLVSPPPTAGPPAQEAPMDRFVLLTALMGAYPQNRHGLIAAKLVSEKDPKADETTLRNLIATAVHAADMDDKDAEITALKAKCTSMETEMAAMKAAMMESTVSEHIGDEHGEAEAPGSVPKDGAIAAAKAAYEAALSAAGRSAGKPGTRTAKAAAEREPANTQELLNRMEAKSQKLADELSVLRAARASDKGVTFVDKKDQSDKPKTLSAAMAAEMKAGTKLRGFELRDHCIAQNPDIERM